MSEYTPETEQEQVNTPGGCSNSVWIAAIVAVTVVTLACIVACTITAYVFLVNAPW